MLLSNAVGQWEAFDAVLTRSLDCFRRSLGLVCVSREESTHRTMGAQCSTCAQPALGGCPALPLPSLRKPQTLAAVQQQVDPPAQSVIEVVKSTIPALKQHGVEVITMFYNELFKRYPAVMPQFNMYVASVRSWHRSSREISGASWY